MNLRDCCERGMVWVNKYSDLTVPEVNQEGLQTGEYSYVDVNIYVCRFCGEVKAEAD